MRRETAFGSVRRCLRDNNQLTTTSEAGMPILIGVWRRLHPYLYMLKYFQHRGGLM